MAKGGRAGIEIVGARELRSGLRKLGDRADDLKDVHQDAGELVAGTARELVDVVSGDLRDTIRTDRRKSGASVIAGRASVPYAGVNHFGWPARNIEPDPFLYDALDQRRDEVVDRYRRGVDELVRKFEIETPG